MNNNNNMPQSLQEIRLFAAIFTLSQSFYIKFWNWSVAMIFFTFFTIIFAANIKLVFCSDASFFATKKICWYIKNIVATVHYRCNSDCGLLQLFFNWENR